MNPEVERRIIEFVRAVTAAMGLSFEVEVEHAADHSRFNLVGDDGDVLLRRRGEALDALQHIATTAFRRELGDNHLVIDCLGYRKGKDAELRQMARFLADRAKATGTPQEIGPLNPYSRRIVHLTVAEDPAVSSESVGDAFLKTVIISVRPGARSGEQK